MSTHNKTTHLLVVDDDAAFSRLLERTLQNAGYHVTCAQSGEMGLEMLAEAPINLVLLDIRMEGIDGFETCRRIKSNPAFAQIPVVFMTAEARSTAMLAQAISAGGSDYLTKPLSRVDVLARVRGLIQRQMESLWFKQFDAEDQPTGLPGRNYLRTRIEEELSECGRFNTPVSLVLVGFEGLEEVYTRHDSEVGEACVRRAALLLGSVSSRHDVVARLGQSSFGMLLPRVNLHGAAMAVRRMEEIWRLTELPTSETESSITPHFAAEGHDGPSTLPSGADLLKHAGKALELAKQTGMPIIGTANSAAVASLL
ncbi:MAG: response regulator [Phycisphaerae bacterium]|nr:response regulator [Phycisphaerae bacterium]